MLLSLHQTFDAAVSPRHPDYLELRRLAFQYIIVRLLEEVSDPTLEEKLQSAITAVTLATTLDQILSELPEKYHERTEQYLEEYITTYVRKS
jgi:hypothetical protein